MAMINCPECGKEIDELIEICPECGYPVKKERLKEERKQQHIEKVNAYRNKQERERSERERAKEEERKTIEYRLGKIQTGLVLCSIICGIIAGIFFYKGYNVKNVYHNSDTYYSSNQNAYVGGDAYNYIINGTYFAGYMAVGGAFTVSSIILLTGSAYISIKEMEREKLWR